MKKNPVVKTRFLLNRVGAMLLALLLLVGGIPMQVLAEDGDEQPAPAEISENGDDLTNTEPTETIEIFLETIVPGEGSLPDDDVLLTQFIEKEGFGRVITPTPAPEKPKLRAPRKIKLEGADLIAYNKLREKINAVLTGPDTITSFTINTSVLFPDKADRWYTAEDLGLETLGNSQTGITKEAKAAIVAQYPIDTNKIFNALMYDCPYDLFWFDKTAGYGSGHSLSRIGYSRIQIPSFTFTFAVSLDYVADNPTMMDFNINGQTVPTPIEVNSSLIQSVNSAISNAAQIVEDAKNKDDYNKLLYYKNQICKAVTYNKAAAENDNTPYGNPWQLIYVFDNVDETNVVCEGYSKAFKYLCDLTAEKGYFDNDTIECHIVTGEMSGGTGSGGHMWNIVTIDGENYLVDVTNCDEGSIGYSEKLFLVGNPNGYITLQGTIIDNNGERDVEFYQYSFPTLGLTYLYDLDTMGSYDSEIILATSNYTPPAPHTHTIEKVPAQVATCESDGYSEHWKCTECGKLFNDAAGETVTTLEAVTTTKLGHLWSETTYAWADDNSSVTASRNCTRAGCQQSETETVSATSEVATQPTCTEKGKTTYTSSAFTNEAFEVQEKTEEDIDALGHTEGSPVQENVVTATCTEAGSYDEVVYCSKCSAELSRSSHQVDPINHNWNEPSYTWSDDNSQVTATRICQNDTSHTETETAQTSSEVTKPATESEQGEITYTAEFTNSGFTKKTKTVPIDVLPHSHNLQKTNKVEPTCEGTGTEAYWNCTKCGKLFSDESATTEIDGPIYIEATGHAFGDWIVTKSPTCTEPGTKQRVCGHNNNHKETGEIEALGHSWNPATYTTPKTCSICGVTEGEPLENDSSNAGKSPEDAIEINEGKKQFAFRTDYGDSAWDQYRWFKFTPDEAGSYEFFLENAFYLYTSNNTSICIYNSLEDAIEDSNYAYFDLDDGEDNETIKVLKYLNKGTTYYLSVYISADYEFGADYEMSLSVKKLSNDVNERFNIDISDVVYYGQNTRPEISIYDKLIYNHYEGTWEEMEQGVDYTLEFAPIEKVGEGTVKIIGKGEYTGSVTKTYSILPLDINDCNFEIGGSDYQEYYYTGSQITPQVELYCYQDSDSYGWEEYELVEGVDYTVSYHNNINAGEATISVKGIGNCTGVMNDSNYGDRLSFYIYPINFEYVNPRDLVVSGLKPVTYNPEGNYTQNPVVKYKGMTLVKDKDYYLEIDNNYYEELDNTLYGTIYISGKGNYEGVIEKSFTINKISLTGAVCTLKSGNSIPYSDDIKYGEWMDYSTLFDVTLNGKKLKVGHNDYGEYWDSDADCYIRLVSSSGNVITVQAVGLNEYKDRSANFRFTVSPALSYLSFDEFSAYDIEYQSVSGEEFEIDVPVYLYTGKEVIPKYQVYASDLKKDYQLHAGTDYTAKYSNNINPGKASVTITGSTAYPGKITRPFIIKAKMSSTTITGITDSPYTGKAIVQNPVVKFGNKTLKKGTDYTLSYKNNVNEGTATVVITGKGYYTGSVSKTFKIKHVHSLKKTVAKGSTCNASGNKEYWTCSTCKKVFSDAKGTTETTVAKMTISKLGHKYGAWTKLNATQHQRVCAHDKKHIEKATHTWDAGKVTKQPTTTATGVKTFTCTVCKATRTETIAKLPVKDPALRRIHGTSRFKTSFAIAETYMKETKQTKLNSIIVASSITFPDALAGSYLAKAKNAPIIIWHEQLNKDVQTFIKQKVKSGGTVYILGGPVAVGESIKQNMGGYKFVRLADTGRYGTNLKILDAVGMNKAEVLVCDGGNDGKGINALIASATGRPLLLVDKNGLIPIQKTWLGKNKGKITKFVIVGDGKSVSAKVETELKAYGAVTRISGKNGDEVSANVASTYYKHAKEIFMATMDDYPDGLCGGPLAIFLKGPILLVNAKTSAASVKYAKTLTDLTRANILGGDKALPEATARKIAKNTKAKLIEYKKQ